MAARRGDWSRGSYSASRAGACLALALLLTLGCAAGAAWPEWLGRGPGPEPDYPDVTVSPSWLLRNAEARGVVVLDARPIGDYLSGHIPGSISVDPWLTPDPAVLVRVFGESGLTGRETFVCCGEGSGSGRAARVFWLLELAGARGAAMLEGGLDGWRALPGTIVTDETTLPPVEWSEDPVLDRIASREFVRRSYGEDGVEIIDARGEDAWRGPVAEALSGNPARSGHIPHALPFDFNAFLGEDGSYLPASETWLEFAALGPRPSNPVDLTSEFIVHGDGITGDGALGYFLLRRAGIERVRYYAGGWSDWASDPYLPVVRIVGAEELSARLRKERRWFRPDAPPGSFAFFDVRHPSDHARGHVGGSVSLDSRVFADSLAVALERHWPDIDTSSAAIVTYCYGVSCIRSRATSTAAARHGFVHVERFYGGVDEWRGIGGRLVEGE
jgi:thiosulfate/3-mercaptopyruvate sulfurtransferase